VSGLLEEARRVERLTGPDREVDGCIWWAMLPPDAVEHHDRSGFVRECIARDGSAGIALQQFYDSSNPHCLARIAFQQPYTASLDAAMTLVPEGWFWMAGNRDRLTPRAYVENGKPAFEGISSRRNPERLWFEVTAATSALALCAAALRARHARDGGE
jgi:hypothetical protein